MSGKNCRAQPDFPTEAETSRKRKRGKSQKSEGAKRWGGTLKTKIGGKENYKTVECHQEVSSASDGEDQKETAPVHKRAGITGTENRSPANTGENPQRGRGSSKGRKKNSTPSRSAAKVSSASDGEDQEDSQLLLDSPGIQGSRDNRQQNGGETPKRGRGRPKGSKNRYQSWAAINKGVVITGADPGAPKRGRGRPKGIKNRTPSLKQEKMGRGRPRKLLHNNGVLTPKLGRGRPKVSKNKIPARYSMKGVVITGADPGAQTPKRGSGRPKGSKNRIPSLKVATGRGRPRKLLHSNGSVTPKLVRGRPKGSKNKMPARYSMKFTGSASGMGVHGDDGGASSDVDKDDFNEEDDDLE